MDNRIFPANRDWRQDDAPQQSDGTLFRYALYFAAFAVVIALAVPVMLNNSDTQYANFGNEIDTRVTGSIKQPVKRYTVRRSILDSN